MRNVKNSGIDFLRSLVSREAVYSKEEISCESETDSGILLKTFLDSHLRMLIALETTRHSFDMDDEFFAITDYIKDKLIITSKDIDEHIEVFHQNPTMDNGKKIYESFFNDDFDNVHIADLVNEAIREYRKGIATWISDHIEDQDIRVKKKNSKKGDSRRFKYGYDVGYVIGTRRNNIKENSKDEDCRALQIILGLEHNGNKYNLFLVNAYPVPSVNDAMTGET